MITKILILKELDVFGVKLSQSTKLVKSEIWIATYEHTLISKNITTYSEEGYKEDSITGVANFPIHFDVIGKTAEEFLNQFYKENI